MATVAARRTRRMLSRKPVELHRMPRAKSAHGPFSGTTAGASAGSRLRSTSGDEVMASIPPPSVEPGSDESQLGLDPKAKLLLVTSDDAIGAPLEESLRRAGHQVTLVREGKAALQFMKSAG